MTRFLTLTSGVRVPVPASQVPDNMRPFLLRGDHIEVLPYMVDSEDREERLNAAVSRRGEQVVLRRVARG